MNLSEGDAKVNGAPVQVRDLTVRAGSNTLLNKTTARFEYGQITLIVGPSGAGKSTLLRVLAGLQPYSGAVTVGGLELSSGKGSHSVGVVFQGFALFDELSPIDNVLFAWDHRPRNGGIGRLSPGLNPEGLLKELGVPRDVRTASLSGGQQQRLAIARTLAYDPAVILYDEPTSGLDVATARPVAELIRKTQATHPKTSIIVTHDFEALTPIADRIYLLDSLQKVLREIEPGRWNQLGDELARLVKRDGDGECQGNGNGRSPPGRIQRMVALPVRDFLSGTGEFLEQVFWLPARLVPVWKSFRWGLRTAKHYFGLVADPLAFLYVGIAGIVAGFVATYFTFRFLPYRSLTEPLVVEEVLQALGFILYRILVPVLTTILVAARCGAAVTSDVGGKVYGRQIDALRTFGVKPERYLLTGILYSFLVGTPLLVLLAFWLAKFTSLWVFTATHPHLGPFFWDYQFHRELTVSGSRLYRGTGWLLGKVLCCAAGMGLIAYRVGIRPKRSSRDVSAGITLAILLSTVHVLLIHLVFALFEFNF